MKDDLVEKERNGYFIKRLEIGKARKINNQGHVVGQNPVKKYIVMYVKRTPIHALYI